MKEEKEMNEKARRIMKFLDTELEGKPYLGSIVFVDKVNPKNSSAGVLKVSNVDKGKTDFLTYSGLLTSLYTWVDSFVKGESPKISTLGSKEKGQQYR